MAVESGADSAAQPRILPPPHGRTQLPLGGRKILGRYRVVAYYGAPGGGQLGVLGATRPEQAAQAIEQRARGFRGYGLRVQPAMELIATVAQAAPGPDGDYSAPIPHSVIRHYLRVAHRHKMLLLLDLQPGRASFLSQAEALRPLLLDPSVDLALDSEWKVGPQGRPGGGHIGSCRARGINVVARYLAGLVRAHRLPDKLLVVHEFTASMLPDRSNIRPARGVEVVFHADGFGSPAVKKGVYRRLRFPGRPFGAGFKLFLTQDSRLMPPRAVMRLRPRPDVITYQ
ncbi:MAG TPA: hypothetical protein VFH38_12400 [Jatrophihabitans sp.]|nr:hypothetical protein [Jatrophihabitans sp.]